MLILRAFFILRVSLEIFPDGGASSSPPELTAVTMFETHRFPTSAPPWTDGDLEEERSMKRKKPFGKRVMFEARSRHERANKRKRKLTSAVVGDRAAGMGRVQRDASR